jgi:hypothetical protein
MTPVGRFAMQTRPDLWLAEQDPPDVEQLGKVAPR